MRLRVRNSVFWGVEGGGITFHIANLSAVPLPPYRILLFHPGRGTLALFEDSKNVPLLPDQERQHNLELIRNQIRPGSITNKQMHSSLLAWFEHVQGQRIENPTGAEVVFRLVMEHSEKVLYENAKAGEAFSNVIIRVCRTGDLLRGGPSVQEIMDMQDWDPQYIRQQEAMVARLRLNKPAA